MFNYLYITNVPEIASYAEDSGVNRIFIDLEVLGKVERQGHLNTFISKHLITDINPVKRVLRKAELLVRINPFNQLTEKEVNDVINEGADIIMLPMFKTIEELESVIKLINGRAKFIPLVETYDAASKFQEISELDGVDEIHIGLNDLHLDMGLNFMFELISSGFISSITKNVKKPFGVGGIATVGQGVVPAELVLAQHLKLGSSGVILSRAFHKSAKSLLELKGQIDLNEEFNKLEVTRKSMLKLSPVDLENKINLFNSKVKECLCKN
ncbi:HpcH/HpaI aldolase/citrate lyase family protein [Vibrio sp. ES.051]|uniref:aldolase/citrate lyase family protein n=1 Tax=Vibrio TaxID=662 RepID=UPI000BF6F5DD|nr:MULTISPECIES: aldolase/citrate lyase family protein [Vibrio]PFG45473.1 HpcH/HpaI aldolase/citrate lyase family protein [Vibrio sp. ES.051]TOK78021.1 aldolase [Vibrio parahaemolyticus]TOK82348.1 aldolase [Vibrio parahaemolyticus]